MGLSNFGDAGSSGSFYQENKLSKTREESVSPATGPYENFERWSMPRRSIALILNVLLILSGCMVHKVQHVPTASVPQPLPDKEKIVGITTLKGEDVSFDDPGASIVNGTLHGWVKK